MSSNESHSDEETAQAETLRKRRIFRHFAGQFTESWLKQLSQQCFKPYIVPYSDNSTDQKEACSFDNFAPVENCSGSMKNYVCASSNAND